MVLLTPLFFILDAYCLAPRFDGGITMSGKLDDEELNNFETQIKLLVKYGAKVNNIEYFIIYNEDWNH